MLLLAFLIKFVLVGIFIGWIPAVIARSKGRSFAAWWLYGTALFIIALIHALVLKPLPPRSCPSCAKPIPNDAKFCGVEVAKQLAIPEGASVEQLIEVLKSGDEVARETAASRLGQLGASAAAALPALEAAKQDPGLKVRARAEWACEQISKH
jgi:hypothetical protein